MSKYIDYFYAPISGYAYLGEKPLVEIAKRFDVKINFKPIDIATVFSRTETTPPFKQSQTRINYRLMDLQRIADKQGLPINPKPLHWPVPAGLAATTIYAASALGIEPHLVSFAMLSAVYAEEKNVSDIKTVETILSELGLDASEILKLANGDEVTAAFKAATEEAIDLGVFGSPSYVYKGEIYFGQDRLSLLEDVLAAE